MDSADVMIRTGKLRPIRSLKHSKNYSTFHGEPVGKNFNHEYAEHVYETVMKMDDDEARQFVTFVTYDTLMEHIQKNRRTVDNKIREIHQEIAKAAERIHPELVPLIEEISKADWDESKAKRDRKGQFARVEQRVRTSRGMKPLSNKQANDRGIVMPDKRLSRDAQSRYQQQYAAILDQMDRLASTGRGSNVELVFENRNTGRRRTDTIGGEGKKTPHGMWDADQEDVVAVRYDNNEQGATYDLVSALGGSQHAATRTNTAVEGYDRARGGSNSFAERWAEAGRQKDGSSTSAVYDRIYAGSDLLANVSSNPKAQIAAQMGRYAGKYGPEAEKIIGPAARKASYRFRGTEREPDKKLVDSVDSSIAQHVSRSMDAEGNPMRRTAIGVQGASAETKMVASREGAIKYLSTRLPKNGLSELHQKSGKIPPSEGVMIDRSGEIVSQSIGFAEDHYLPFNLKKLGDLKGGSYVRTRTTGGLTTEDIYTGLVSGARQVTVVSNSGFFTLDFSDDFRGGRRYNDKAAAMTERYAKTLDAIKNGQIERDKLTPMQRAEIREAAEAEGWQGEQLATRIAELEQEYKTSTIPTKTEVANLQRKATEAVSDMSIPTDQRRAMYNKLFQESYDELSNAKQQRYYRLDGEGYAMALEALKEQFPYYIDDITYVSNKRFKQYGEKPQKMDPSGAASFSSADDKGYVKAKYNRAEAQMEGYYDEEIAGKGKGGKNAKGGKTAAHLTNYQNWSNNPIRGKSDPRTEATHSSGETPVEAPKAKKEETPAQKKARIAAAGASRAEENAAYMSTVAGLKGLDDDSILTVMNNSQADADILNEFKKSPDTVLLNGMKRDALRQALAKVPERAEAIASGQSDPKILGALNALKDSARKANEKIEEIVMVQSSSNITVAEARRKASEALPANARGRLNLDDRSDVKSVYDQAAKAVVTLDGAKPDTLSDESLSSVVDYAKMIAGEEKYVDFLADMANNPEQAKLQAEQIRNGAQVLLSSMTREERKNSQATMDNAIKAIENHASKAPVEANRPSYNQAVKQSSVSDKDMKALISDKSPSQKLPSPKEALADAKIFGYSTKIEEKLDKAMALYEQGEVTRAVALVRQAGTMAMAEEPDLDGVASNILRFERALRA